MSRQGLTNPSDWGAAARDRLIVALDVADPDAARSLVAQLGDAVGFYKIGLELTYGGGLSLVRDLVAAGKKVFLDLKLHDIPQTVEQATARVAGLGATYLTVHAYPHTMAAAAAGARGSGLSILGVTVLTSMSDADLLAAGYGVDVETLVARRAGQAVEAGIAGIVCSAVDIAGVRTHLGAALEVVTPGIRPAGSALADQKRVMTPFEAIRAGADRLVVGRPITEARDPEAAAAGICAEIAAAIHQTG